MSKQNDFVTTASNKALIVLYIIICVAIYTAFRMRSVNLIDSFLLAFKEYNLKDSFLMIISPLLSVLLTGLISDGYKARLVFFRCKDALPGHRAFSVYALKDHRIDMSVLKEKLGKLPEDPAEQNARWYQIYRKHKGVASVKQAQKNFLLTRDMAAISFIFSIFGAIGLKFGGFEMVWVLQYFALMFLLYIFTAIAARNYGHSFVRAVLVEEVIQG